MGFDSQDLERNSAHVIYSRTLWLILLPASKHKGTRSWRSSYLEVLFLVFNRQKPDFIFFSINADRGATVFSWALDCYLQTSESEILWCCSIKMPALQDLAHCVGPNFLWFLELLALYNLLLQWAVCHSKGS